VRDQVREDAEAADYEVRNSDEADTALDKGAVDGFDDLILFVFFVLDTCLVVADTFDHQSLFFVAEALAFHGRVG
jgi:hypothetical protein